ncbi:MULTISPECIES: DUF2189 domain-containing protein [Microvirgula]|uniref:DUF2189 domain-containing protein n=1 Tax=Microvirgula TaxID=57479 RepID=UPI00048DED45|nr:MULTISPECIES: DUF2189 domain-containing protein [Microvirgula]RAS15554.1 putative membrane protein [Microvirgula sp. AG722]
MDITHAPVTRPPAVRHVDAAAPLSWLLHALLDFRRAPAVSLFYGAAFVVMGYLMFFYFGNRPEYVITCATAFLLLGPFLSIGLYDIAQRLEQHGEVHLLPTLTAWRANLPGITLFAVMLAMLVFFWFRISQLMFALFYTGDIPALSDIVANAFTAGNLGFLVVYFGLGLIFAAVAFSFSVVAIPMMLDRNVDTVTAILTSLHATAKNIPAMLVWAGLIALLTVIGFATFAVGLAILMPLIGLASWHAYRALVE